MHFFVASAFPAVVPGVSQCSSLFKALYNTIYYDGPKYHGLAMSACQSLLRQAHPPFLPPQS